MQISTYGTPKNACRGPAMMRIFVSQTDRLKGLGLLPEEENFCENFLLSIKNFSNLPCLKNFSKNLYSKTFFFALKTNSRNINNFDNLLIFLKKVRDKIFREIFKNRTLCRRVSAFSDLAPDRRSAQRLVHWNACQKLSAMKQLSSPIFFWEARKTGRHVSASSEFQLEPLSLCSGHDISTVGKRSQRTPRATQSPNAQTGSTACSTTCTACT